MTIEIVDLPIDPIEHGGFFHGFLYVYQRVGKSTIFIIYKWAMAAIAMLNKRVTTIIFTYTYLIYMNSSVCPFHLFGLQEPPQL